MTSPSTTLSLVDTDPAELAVDAIVDRRAQPDRRAGRHQRPRRHPAARQRRGEHRRRVRRQADRDAARCSARPAAPGEVTKLATLGTVTAPLVVAVGLGPEPTGRRPGPGDAAPGRRRGGPGAGRRADGGAGAAAAGRRRRAGRAARGRRGRAARRRTGSPATRPSRSRPGGSRWPRCWSPCRTPRDAAAQAEVDPGRGGGRRGPARPGTGSTPRRTSCARRRSPTRSPRPPRGRASTSRCSTRRRCAAGGYGGILAVGQGSEAPPRLVKLTYTPAGRRQRQAGRAGRQGHHLRHRRHLDQAGAGHVGDEVRHGRRGRGGARPCWRSPR